MRSKFIGSNQFSGPSDTAERFWGNVTRTDGCWLWTGRINYGYGYFAEAQTGRSLRAHRVAWVLTYGPVPDGLFVLHKCDVRACVNPAHLWLGTHLDNMRDMREKGRASHSSAGGQAVAAKFAARPTCAHGHVRTPATTYVKVLSDGRRKNVCRICRNAASTKAHQRSRAV